MQAVTWTPESPALIVVEPKIRLQSACSADCELLLHFRPFRIPQGAQVKSTVFLASTGAFVSFRSHGGRVGRWTSQAPTPAKLQLEEKTSHSAELSPKLELDIAKVGIGRERVESLEYCATSQASLSAKCIDRALVEWHYSLYRGPKPVRDYLDETLQLEASSEWRPPAKESYLITAELDDIAFYGSDKRRLTGFNAYLLQVKLKLAGIDLPTAGKVVCHVDV